jgi:carbon storage regulator
MMVMRRREGEKILIGDNIVIHIERIGRSKVKIGIVAPRDLPIIAEEMRVVREENLAAATVNVSSLHSKIFPQSS